MKRSILLTLVVLVLTIFVVLTVAGSAQATVIELVSVSSAGVQGNATSSDGYVTADGRYVAFESDATTLVPGGGNQYRQIYVRDRVTGQTTRVSVDGAGTLANGMCEEPSISDDGRYVAFQSYASNLVPNDTNNKADIFVHDRQTGGTSRVSKSTAGVQTNDHSASPVISADGAYVVFSSDAWNLIGAGNDINWVEDVFRHEIQTGVTIRVSVSSSGAAGNYDSLHPSISGDGRYVAFDTRSQGFAPGDSQLYEDVFVRDCSGNTTTLISQSTGGARGNGVSRNPSISRDGRFVAFDSYASNLVASDYNGDSDVFLRDRTNNSTIRVSVTSSGAEVSGHSEHASASRSGEKVAFGSESAGLVTGDQNNANDVFVYETATDTVTRVSVNFSGTEGNGISRYPMISADGNHVVLDSGASNLGPGDGNSAYDVLAAALYPAPTVTALSPNHGPPAGGNTVEVTGTSFKLVKHLNFGGTRCTDFTVASTTKITAKAPAHAAGAVDVRVVTAGGVSTTSGKGNDYSYLTRSEQTDSGLAYSGAWEKIFAATAASGGTYARAKTVDAFVVIPFSGARLDWIGAKGYSQGRALVSVDGKAPTTVDLYRAAGGLFQQRLFSTGTLTSSLHWVKISWDPANIAGRYINLDAVEVAGTLSAPKRYQETDTKLVYTPAWSNGASAYASEETYRYTSAYNAQVTVNFSGVSIDILSRKAPDYGRLALSLDGGAWTLVDLYGPTVTYGKVWSSPFVAPGNHTLVIKRSVQKNAASTGYTVALDALDVRGVLR